MDYVHLETEHVAGLKEKSGDPSPVTAHGVFRAILASAKNRWGSDDLNGKVVTIQGVGNVGRYLANELHEAGAKLVVSDIYPERTARVARETGATVVEGDAIYTQKADIFAPCALGGIINDENLPRLNVEIICGGANNQLLEERHGYMLEEMGMQYTPDYVANAGGVINVFGEVAGWDSERALRKADEIYDTVLTVFEIAKAEGIPSFEAADRLAERRLASVRKKWTPKA
jgi:leucine dehydrogenase